MDQFLGFVKNTAESFVGDGITKYLEPLVRREVDEQVAKFRSDFIQSLPSRTQEGIERITGGNPILAQALPHQNVEKISLKITAIVRPLVERSTEGVTESITQLVVTETKERVGNVFDSKHGDEQQRQLEQQQQQQPRGLGGFIQGLSQGTANGLINPEQTLLPKIMAAIREKAHPIFESLKPKLWELFPEALRQVLQEVIERGIEAIDRDEPQQRQIQEPQIQQQDRGFFGDMLKAGANQALDRFIPDIVEGVRVPVQGQINESVNGFEENVMITCDNKIRDALVTHKPHIPV